MLNTTPTIAGVSFPFCLMNAAGALSTSREELLALAYSESGAVVTKSITPESFLDPGARCGIENPGVAYYTEIMSELRRTGKPVIASVAGLTVDEFVVVAQTLAAAGADLIEINLNDPHVHTHLSPFASTDSLANLVSTFRRSIPAPLAVKFPSVVPLSLAEVAAVLLEAGVPAVICHNTRVDGGPSQAETILQAAKGRLDVIGVGGVSSGAEALDVLCRGIKAIQIGSVVVKEGAGVFARLKREMADNVEARN